MVSAPQNLWDNEEKLSWAAAAYEVTVTCKCAPLAPLGGESFPMKIPVC